MLKLVGIGTLASPAGRTALGFVIPTHCRYVFAVLERRLFRSYDLNLGQGAHAARA